MLVKRLKSSPSKSSTTTENNNSSKVVGAKIYILSDVDCRVFDYDEDLSVQIVANKKTPIRLLKGNHDLTFVSTEFPNAKICMNYDVDSNDYCNQLKVSLSEEVQLQQKIKQSEIEAEERAKSDKEKAERKSLEIRKLKRLLPNELSFDISDTEKILMKLHPSKTLYYSETEMQSPKQELNFSKEILKGIGALGSLGGLGAVAAGALAIGSFIFPVAALGVAAGIGMFVGTQEAKNVKCRQLTVEEIKDVHLSTDGHYLAIPIFEDNNLEYFLKRFEINN